MRLLLSIFLLTTYTLTAFAQLNKVPEQNIPADYGYLVKQGDNMPEVEFKLTDGKTVK